MVKRRNFTDQFKAKVALEALRGDKTIQEIAAQHQVHPNQVSSWKKRLLEEGAGVFSRKRAGEQRAQAEQEAALYGIVQEQIPVSLVVRV